MNLKHIAIMSILAVTHTMANDTAANHQMEVVKKSTTRKNHFHREGLRHGSENRGHARKRNYS